MTYLDSACTRRCVSTVVWLVIQHDRSRFTTTSSSNARSPRSSAMRSASVGTATGHGQYFAANPRTIPSISLPTLPPTQPQISRERLEEYRKAKEKAQRARKKLDLKKLLKRKASDAARKLAERIRIAGEDAREAVTLDEKRRMDEQRASRPFRQVWRYSFDDTNNR